MPPISKVGQCVVTVHDTPRTGVSHRVSEVSDLVQTMTMRGRVSRKRSPPAPWLLLEFPLLPAEAHVIHVQEERLEAGTHVVHAVTERVCSSQAFTSTSSVAVSGLISVAVSLLMMLIGLEML